MYFASESGWQAADAERAFGKAVRARERAARRRRLARPHEQGGRLAIHDAGLGASRAGEVREIPLEAIVGTLEPHRAEQFDCEFRPSQITRHRWLRVWLAEVSGAGLPPISVTAVG